MLGGPAPEFSLKLWHGVNLPLIMSGVALGGGVLLYFLLQYGLDLHATCRTGSWRSALSTAPSSASPPAPTPRGAAGLRERGSRAGCWR